MRSQQFFSSCSPFGRFEDELPVPGSSRHTDQSVGTVTHTMTPVSRSTGRRCDRRTRSARAEARDGRDVLLDAALGVFAERGYRDASIDEIAERAGYSKGAVYWHVSSKDELFSTLLEERLDKPWREGIPLLQSASADTDMAPQASARFTAMLRGQRELVLLDQEYWSLAVRDPKLRIRYANASGSSDAHSAAPLLRGWSTSGHHPSTRSRRSWPPPSSPWARAWQFSDS